MTTSDSPLTPERLRELAEAAEPRTAGLARAFAGADVTEVLLIRHAQMPQSEAGDNFPLTDLGREQAEVLAAHLTGRRLDALYCSPTTRTQQTAAPIARSQGLTIETIEDLEDIRHFLPPGKTMRDLVSDEERAEMDRRMLIERRWDVRGKYTESSESLRRRAVSALESIFERWPGGRVAVVTHGPLINAYIGEILHSPYDAFFHAKLASVTVVLGKDEHRFIQTLNSRAHFGAI